MRYFRMMEEVWGTASMVGEPVDHVLPDELELQSLWYAGAMGRDFSTVEGRQVRIVQFGEWNRGAGPDFHHAVVAVDGVEYAGAVELDPHAADWENHGHGANADYRNVVLHVSFTQTEREYFIRTDEHKAVTQVVVPAAVWQAAFALPKRAVAMAVPGRCVKPLQGMNEAAVADLLREAAEHRARLKARNFLLTAEAHGRDEALFQAVAVALGYRSNALAMRLLAQRCPLRLMKEAGTAVEAILFGMAGFLSADQHERASGETREYLRGLWEDWWKWRGVFLSKREMPWVMRGQRPANHPHRRVAALAALASQWAGFRRVAMARPFSAKRVVAFLEDLRHPFWNGHLTLAAAPTVALVALFGRSHALEFIANFLAPLAMQEDGNFSYETFLRIKSTTRNEKLRRCAIRLFGSEAAAAPWMKSIAHQQAMLQLYHDFCLEDTSDCERCPFPEQLAQWIV